MNGGGIWIKTQKDKLLLASGFGKGNVYGETTLCIFVHYFEGNMVAGIYSTQEERDKVFEDLCWWINNQIKGIFIFRQDNPSAKEIDTE